MSGVDGFIVLANTVAVGFGLELMAFFLTAPKERNGVRREREEWSEERGRGEKRERERATQMDGTSCQMKFIAQLTNFRVWLWQSGRWHRKLAPLPYNVINK